MLLSFEAEEPKDDPIIVHFCGHGTGKKGLVFEDRQGNGDLVSTNTLKDFFALFEKRVTCVVMNACYSEVQAKAINEHIKYVIGMNQAIRDDAAIAFSIGFYRALGYGKSFEDAFKFGKNAIQLAIGDAPKSREAITEEMRKLVPIGEISEAFIEEHLKPVLKVNRHLPNLINPIQPELKTSRNEQAIATWKERLAFFEAQLPIAAANEKFSILKHIEECQQNIKRLEG